MRIYYLSWSTCPIVPIQTTHFSINHVFRPQSMQKKETKKLIRSSIYYKSFFLSFVLSFSKLVYFKSFTFIFKALSNPIPKMMLSKSQRTVDIKLLAVKYYLLHGNNLLKLKQFINAWNEKRNGFHWWTIHNNSSVIIQSISQFLNFYMKLFLLLYLGVDLIR